jgi:hypothetical protein
MADPCKLYQWTDGEPYTFVRDLCAGADTPIQTRLNTGRERMLDQMQRDLERLEAPRPVIASCACALGARLSQVWRSHWNFRLWGH